MLRSAPAALVIAALIAVAPLLAGCPSGSSAPTMQVYTSKSWGFSISLPGDWKKWDGGPGSILEAYPPDQTDPNNRTDIMYVSGESFPDTVALPQMYTLDEYVTIKSKGASSNMPGYKEVEKKQVDVNGTPAIRFVYTAAAEDWSLTSVAYFLIADRRAYTILCTADSSRYKDREPVYDQIATSFRLEKTAETP